MDIARCFMVGRLTRDSELKYSTGGTAITHFSIATGTRVKEGDAWKDKTSFWDCTIFGKTGESVNQYLTKGKQIAVSGKMEIDTWEKDGAKQSKVKIIVDDVQLLGGGNKEGEQPRAPSKPATGNSPATFQDDDPEQIPF